MFSRAWRGSRWATGVWAALYYFFFWLVPIFTSFSFFMILRQIVQHGNGGRGWLTNTRIFLLQPSSASPSSRSARTTTCRTTSSPRCRTTGCGSCTKLLLEYPEYREQAVVVEGYFLPPHTPQTRPTVLDVLGPDYAPRDGGRSTSTTRVLEDDEVEEKAEILREGELEKRRAAAGPQSAAG